ncbi:MAG: hypothetical protein ACAI35_02675 [Candidatus Methylacidiphilales bacterium]
MNSTLLSSFRNAVALVGVTYLFIALIAVLCLGGMWMCSASTAPTRAEVLLAKQLGNQKLVLGSDLKTWISALGPPSVVDQSDDDPEDKTGNGGHTYFYWPSHGVAVFCSPHLNRQYYYNHRDDWIVTIIMVPLQHDIPALNPPCVPDIRVRFTRLVSSLSEIQHAAKGEATIEMKENSYLQMNREMGFWDVMD